MKNKLLFKSIKVAITTCPIDCIIMILAQTVITLLPTAILLANQRMVKSLRDQETIICCFGFVILYCLMQAVQKALMNWYHHYYVTYYSLLKFEKNIKKRLFHICANMELDDL